MNYRHAYHAGNFADVVKHAVLALVITHLRNKPAPFRIIDTHAGAGLYDLRGEAAEKTGEWRDGIARLVGPEAEPIPQPQAESLKPYLDVVRAMNPAAELHCYPGSPRLARALMRPGDRLVANELHPEDGAALRSLFARDPDTKVLHLDGWTALKALLPPKERRGAILIDPPFEEPDDLDRLREALRQGVARFATGIYLLWYPIKDHAPKVALERALQRDGHAKLLQVDVFVRAPRRTDVLNGAGLFILNPPYRLDEVLQSLMPFLAVRLAQGSGSRATVRWLARERPSHA
ncbi:MAG TPA: 23S rRNA (adenine(2030)-N(6))-methyltransferase RlmJ [Hyphomicrobiaceae bacterium]|nr:23S rRNA (adenine(2030)-N(6))-methyltransferase RlmJ [Hyphomicrobiaceae bacterium]